MMNSTGDSLRASRWLSSRFISLSGALLVLLLSGPAFAQTAPTANAGGPYGVDQGASVSLDGSGSSDTDGTNIGIVLYEWDLDNDGTYDTTGPSTAFSSATAGTFTVVLRVTDGDDETATDTATVNVSGLDPTVEAGGPYSGNQDVGIPLSGSGSDPSGIAAYTWDLDNNGSFETAGQNPTFNSAVAGTFTVVLRVTDNDGATATDTATVNVNGLATAEAGGPYSGNEGENISLNGSGSDDSGIASYAWDLDNNGSFETAGQNPTFNSAVAGTFTVILRVTANDGDTATDTATVNVNGLATAEAGGPYSGDEGENISLNGSGSDDSGIASYAWDLDNNGSFETAGQNPTFNSAVAGTFTVILRVTANDGDTVTDTATVNVNGLATAEAGGPYSGDEGENISLNGSGSDDSGIASYAWDLDNNGSFETAGQNPTFNSAVAGTFTVILRVTANDGDTVTDTATVNVNGLATAEAGGPYSGDEGENISLNGSGSDDSGIASYAWDLDNNGSFETAGQNPTFNSAVAGTFTVILRVTANDGDTVTDTATVNVNGLATAEAGGPYSGDEGENISLNGSGSDDSGIASYAWDLDNNGSFETAGQNPTFNSAVAGTFTVILRVTANDGDTATDTATVNVNGLPTADAGGPYSGNEGDTITLNASGSSDPGGVITAYAWDLDEDGQYDDATGISPNFTLPAAGSITSIGLQVTDNLGAIDTDTAAVNINGLPTADAGGPYSGNEGDTITLNGSGSSDAGGVITAYAWDLDGDGQYDDATGISPNFTLPAAGSITSIGLQVTDNGGAIGTDTAAVSINGLPTANDQGPVVTPEDTPVDITLTGSDPENQPLTFTVTNNPGNGSVDCTGANCTYTPNNNYNGADSFTFKVNDGAVDSASDGTVSITVNAVNDAPTANDQGPVVTPEDTPVDITLTGSDPENQALTFTVTSNPGNGSVDCTGANCTYTPNNNYNGVDSFTFKVNDGAADSASDGTVSITVNAENDIPTATAQSFTTDEDMALPIVLAGTDPEGDPLTFTVETQPSSGSVNCEGATGADCTYTPDPDFYGADSFTFTASDGEFTSPAATISITVNTVNDAPTATPQSVSTDEDTALPIVLAGTDPEDDVLTFAVVTQPTNGTLSGEAPNLTYTPNTDFNGTDSFTFTVSDAALTSAEATITIDVGALNDDPVADAQTVVTDEDVAIDITLTGLDPDEDPLSFAIVDQPTNGLLTGTGANVSYTPSPDFNGNDSFTFTVSDGVSTSLAATVAITVNPVNDAPTATPQSVSTEEDTALPIVLAGTDLEGDDLTFTVETQPSNGILSGEAPSVTYTPNFNYNGADTFTFTINDGELTSTAAAITIEIASVNDQPVLETPIEDPDNPILAVEGDPFILDISGNFTDPDGDPLQFTASGLPASGNLDFDPVTGVFSGTPRVEDARDNDPYIIRVTATDGDPDTIPATDEFNLNISALDRANVSLDISVAPDPAMLNDELSWTFTASNTVGPQIATNVEITGSLVGSGLTISSTGSCTIQATVDQVTEFDCTIGSLAIGETASVQLVTVTSTAGDVVVFATAANIDPLPLDPNLADNSRQIAVGVAEEFSNGAVETLGTTSVLSMAAGDVNGDGAADLVIGTVAGQPIQIYLSDGFRDFVTPPISLPDTSANEGIELADFDNNGTLDLVVANGDGQPDGVYLNDGAGNFTLVAEPDSAPSMVGVEGNFAMNALSAPTSSHDVAVADFNGDGNSDIVFATVEGNLVYLGDGFGNFSLYATLGAADSHGIAVGDFNGTAGPDIVFANVGSDSQIWLNNGVDGFDAGESLPIGDAVSVTVGQFGGDARLDLAFGRVPTVNGDVPANPVLINDGAGGFGPPVALLGTSPTSDILAGDVNSDGLTDLVFVNASGVHQIWTATASGFELHGEQIVDGGASVGVLAELGFADVGDPGGVDLALGGALQVGTSVYLNDGFGNLGRGDAVPPLLTLNGSASLDVPAGSSYVDAGAVAEDNIDGDISTSIVVTAAVNTALVGSYTVTYDVSDFAGNSATPITRTVNVIPAAGTGGGGGGGGAASPLLLILLMLAAFLTAWQANRAIIQVSAQKQYQRGSGNV